MESTVEGTEVMNETQHETMEQAPVMEAATQPKATKSPRRKPEKKVKAEMKIEGIPAMVLPTHFSLADFPSEVRAMLEKGCLVTLKASF